MATQTQTQEGVEHEQPRHRRRAKERPDALENQFSRLSETSSSTEQNNTGSDRVVSKTNPVSTLEEVAHIIARMDQCLHRYLAEACKKLDHEEFDLQTLGKSNGCPTVSDWAGWLKLGVKNLNWLCISGFSDAEAYLKHTQVCTIWAEADVVFSQSMDRSRYDLGSGPVVIAENLVSRMTDYSNRHSVLITDLLPESVELKEFDLQMQAVLRRKWAILDSMLESWYLEGRESNCTVPRWGELSQLFKHSAADKEDQLPAQLSYISSALWLSLLVFLTTVPTTALGWRYSPHQPGTTQDADFWFLMQSSCMTILSFAVLAIPIWGSKSFSAKARFWVWGLLIAASLCVALSPLVYIFGPTQWSQFMSIVSGIVQALLTLQIALVADHAGKESGKSGKKDK